MDPNETLKEIRRLTQHVYETPEDASAASELTCQMADLDEWLSRGGFLPTDWEHK